MREQTRFARGIACQHTNPYYPASPSSDPYIHKLSIHLYNTKISGGATTRAQQRQVRNTCMRRTLVPARMETVHGTPHLRQQGKRCSAAHLGDTCSPLHGSVESRLYARTPRTEGGSLCMACGTPGRTERALVYIWQCTGQRISTPSLSNTPAATQPPPLLAHPTRLLTLQILKVCHTNYIF